MGWKHNWYNKRSAKKHNWDPSWFGATAFNNTLTSNIKEFQSLHGLKADGYCGPLTYRRAYTNKEAYGSEIPDQALTTEATNFIICGGLKVPVEWPKVETSWIKEGCFSPRSTLRTPTMVVTHWDAALSAKSCKRILERRKISTHFVIDNDGTILQLVDTNHVAWHAGNRRVNKASVGVDFSNAVYTKYNKVYKKRGFGERPIIEGWRVHGRKVKPFLGYYPVQIDAYKALLKALHKHYGIPLDCPLAADGKLLTKVHNDSKRARFKGVVNHYNLTRGKWDSSGLQLDVILKEIATN